MPNNTVPAADTGLSSSPSPSQPAIRRNFITDERANFYRLQTEWKVISGKIASNDGIEGAGPDEEADLEKQTAVLEDRLREVERLMMTSFTPEISCVLKKISILENWISEEEALGTNTQRAHVWMLACIKADITQMRSSDLYAEYRETMP